MAETPAKPDDRHSPDWYFRGTLRRVGEIADRFSGRKWSAASSLATSSLIEKIKKALDDAAIEVQEKGTIVPHLIELRMQWDKFSVDDETTIEKVESELVTAAADYINDRLYYTRGPLRITVKSDYFTEGVKLSVSFGDGSTVVADEEVEKEINVTFHNVDRAELAAAISSVDPDKTNAPQTVAVTVTNPEDSREYAFELTGPLRITIGRGANNDIVLKDDVASKLHAAVSFDPEGNAKLADLGSTNGTYIGGERIPYGKAIDLADGEKIVIGSTKIACSIVKDTTDSNELTPDHNDEVNGSRTND